jgi:Ribbon-helix-helix protein, copG family
MLGGKDHRRNSTRRYHTYGMHKTAVYLNDEEVEALRQLAAATGRSRAELIREAIRHVAAQAPPRRFRSLGKGESKGGPAGRWQPAAIYARLFSTSDSDSNADTGDGQR